MSLRRSLGAGETDVVALFVGGDWDRKGLSRAIAGLSDAWARGSHNVKLWVVGSGDVPRFATEAERVGVSDGVSFAGPQEDPAPYFRSADLLLAPSDYEAFSLAMLEGAAAGLPVITTEIGGAREIVGAEDGGLIVAPRAEQIGSALAMLATDGATRARMAAAARARAEAFTWDASIASVLGEYEQLLANRSGHLALASPAR
jgi:UDP-glucose:(heptosyl)LPS alpha-1,3-glucosyltransferase